MNRTIVLGLCVLLIALTGCASNPAPVPAQPLPPQPQATPVTILAIGDSLTEGLGLQKEDAYPAQLEAALQAKGYNVVVTNAGVSGETTTGLAARTAWLTRTPQDIIILCSGANDGLRGLPVDRTEENLETIIEALQKTNATIILAGMIAPQNNGKEYTDAFSAMYPRLAEKYRLEYVPFLLTGVAGDATLNQADQVHPTREGYTVIVENNLLPVVEPLVQQYSS